MWRGWWQANMPEEMEEAHRGEWWEEMMRMMSAEWLASGTDLVRLSAKGVEDTERDDCSEDKTERAWASRRKMMINVKILLPCDNQGFPRLVLHDHCTSLWLCYISANQWVITNLKVSELEKAGQRHVLFSSYYINSVLQFQFLLFMSISVAQKRLGLPVPYTERHLLLLSSSFSSAESGPSHRNNDDPVLSLSPSYSQFSSVLIIVPELHELLLYQNREGARRDKKRGRGREESQPEREEGERLNPQGGRKERMTKYKDGWIDMYTDRNRKTEKVKPEYLLWFVPYREHNQRQDWCHDRL